MMEKGSAASLKAAQEAAAKVKQHYMSIYLSI